MKNRWKLFYPFKDEYFKYLQEYLFIIPYHDYSEDSVGTYHFIKHEDFRDFLFFPFGEIIILYKINRVEERLDLVLKLTIEDFKIQNVNSYSNGFTDSYWERRLNQNIRSKKKLEEIILNYNLDLL